VNSLNSRGIAARRWLLLRGFLGAAVLLAGIGQLGTAAAAPAAVPATGVATAAQAADSQSSSATASAEADATGKPVTVDDLTTPTQVVVAQPGGGFTATLSVEPVRRLVGGEWRNLDSTLRLTSDGDVQPVLANGDLTLSPGGPAGSMIAGFRSAGYGYAVDSPFALPAPELSGDTATYEDVLPGIDLVVVALSDGFSYNWVVKTPAAAADPRIAELSLPVHASGLTPHTVKGATAYDDEHGVHRLWVSAPLMWDSASAASSAAIASDASAPGGDLSSAELGRAAQGVGEAADPQIAPDLSSAEAVEQGAASNHVAGVEQIVSADRVTLRPDLELLAGPETVYPVVIDPSPAVAIGAYTTVWDIYPDKSFWKTGHSLGAGFEGYEQNKIVRSYFQFDTKAFIGKRIISASLNLNQIHDASCSPRATNAYRTGEIKSTTTWNNKPSRISLQDSNSSTAGCPGSGSQMVRWDVSTGVAKVAAQAGESATFAITAADETDRIAWKQFDDNEGRLVVHYVSAPAKPTAASVRLQTPNKSYTCGTAAAPTVVGSRTVTLLATAHSADLANATLAVVYRRWVGSTAQAAIVTGSKPASDKGDLATTMVWTTTVDGVYHFTAATRTYWSAGGVTSYLDSAESDPCYFKVDLTAPLPPKVTSTAFAECGPASDPTSCPSQGVVGVAGAMKFERDPSDPNTSDIVAYHWTLNGGAVQNKSVSPGAAHEFALTPTKQSNVLAVWATDAAGNNSPSVQWIFHVTPPVAADVWDFENGDGLANSVSATRGTLSLGSNVIASPGRVGHRALQMRGCLPPTSTTDATVQANTSFTASLWVRVTTGNSVSFLVAPSVSGTANSLEIGYDSSSEGGWTAGDRVRQGGAVFSGLTVPGAKTNRWTHLAVTYNQVTGVRTLYVNGSAAGSYTVADSLPATSGWRIGCGSRPSNCLCAAGAVDDVELYQGVLPADQIAQLADPVDPDTNQNIVSSEARWDMTNASSQGIVDGRFGAILTTNVRPVVDPDDATTALDFLGASTQSVRTSGPVVDTSGSFSISAHVRLADQNRSMVIAQGGGPSGPAWTLGYRAVGDGSNQGQWYFSRSVSPAAGAATVEARSWPQVFDGYVVVIGVYDGSDKTLHVTYGGIEDGTQGSPPLDSVQGPSFGSAWNADGDFSVGNGTDSGTLRPFYGQIDYVEAFAGALLGDLGYQYANGGLVMGGAGQTPSSGLSAPIMIWHDYPGGDGKCYMYFTNTAPEFYSFEWTIDDGQNYLYSDALTITIAANCQNGDYTAKVRVVDPYGNASPWTVVQSDYSSWS
jgi:hypothetical protein